MKYVKGVLKRLTFVKFRSDIKPWFSLIVIALLCLVIYAAYLADHGNVNSEPLRQKATVAFKSPSINRLMPSQTKEGFLLTPIPRYDLKPSTTAQSIITTKIATTTLEAQVPINEDLQRNKQTNDVQKSTPNYITALYEAIRKIRGEWQGIATTKVNRAERQKQPVKLTFQADCSIGLVCGKYHFDSQCFGDLILKKLSGATLIFVGQNLSGFQKCVNNGLFYIRLLSDRELSFGTVLINSEGKITVQGTSLSLVHR